MLLQQRLLHIPEQAVLVSRRERLPRQAEEGDRGCESGEGRVVEDCGRGGYVDYCCVGDCGEDLDWEEFLFLYCDLRGLISFNALFVPDVDFGVRNWILT